MTSVPFNHTVLEAHRTQLLEIERRRGVVGQRREELILTIPASCNVLLLPPACSPHSVRCESCGRPHLHNVSTRLPPARRLLNVLWPLWALPTSGNDIRSGCCSCCRRCRRYSWRRRASVVDVAESSKGILHCTRDTNLGLPLAKRGRYHGAAPRH